MTIYRTQEYSGYGKQNYYWYEYRQEGDTVYKYKCHRFKFFNGDENTWETEESLVEMLDVSAKSFPAWLKGHLR